MSNLDIFTVPKTDFTIKSSRYAAYSPVSTGITPMEFSIGSLDDYCDLGRSYMVVKLRLNTSADNGLVADEETASNAEDTRFVYVTNNLGHTLFKQMNLRFNGALMSEQTDTYAYSAFIETLLNFNQGEGETTLAPQGWVNYLNVTPTLEATGANDDICTTDGWKHASTNALKKATSLFYGKNEVELVIRPHLEAFHTGRVLVPGVEMKLQLFFNSPSFFLYGTLTSGTGRKHYVTLSPQDVNVTFYLCRLTLNDAVYDALEKERKVSNKWAKYPTVRSEIRTFTFAGNTTKFTENNIFLGRVPDRMIVGLVRSEAFNGELNWYPFSFQKFGVRSIRQIVNGEEYPYPALELNGDNALKDYKGYHRLLLATAKSFKGGEFMVKPSDWGHGKNCTLFMWCNVASGFADSKQKNPKQAGDVRLEIDFHTNIGANITVIVWGEFENQFEIDKHGGVLYNIRE